MTKITRFVRLLCKEYLVTRIWCGVKVRNSVQAAVIIDTSMVPSSITTTHASLPNMVKGTLSPYPVVVIWKKKSKYVYDYKPELIIFLSERLEGSP
jgi:hypothetical protein